MALERELRTEITTAASRAGGHDRGELENLLEARYSDLRDLAHHLVAREAPGASVEATALVHLAYERLLDESQLGEKGSVVFRAAFARVARRILVERARARRRKKRGGDRRRESLHSEHLQLPTDTADAVDFHLAMEELSAHPRTGPRMTRVVELRVFGGLTVDECAAELGVSKRTVDTDWRLAAIFLRKRLSP